MNVRLAKKDELGSVNELRKQVNDLHARNKPEIFRQGFAKDLQDFIYEIWADPLRDIVVAEQDGKICGFAALRRVSRPETPYMRPRDYLDVDEFGVDETCRRQGVGTAMVAFIKEYALKNGFERIELNMWEFNTGALAFYEAAGFATYRRYMELIVSPADRPEQRKEDDK